MARATAASKRLGTFEMLGGVLLTKQIQAHPHPVWQTIFEGTKNRATATSSLEGEEVKSVS